MHVFLETERQLLRRFTGDDVDELVELDARRRESAPVTSKVANEAATD